MAGYRHKPKIYRLQFADEEFDGLEVVVRSLPVGEFMSLIRLQNKLDEDDTESVEELFKIFTDKLIGWNLEDEEGTKVPRTLAGLMSLDLSFVLQIVGAWIEAMGGVDKDLGKDSTSGGTFLEAAIPTEALSGSLPN